VIPPAMVAPSRAATDACDWHGPSACVPGWVLFGSCCPLSLPALQVPESPPRARCAVLSPPFIIWASPAAEKTSMDPISRTFPVLLAFQAVVFSSARVFSPPNSPGFPPTLGDF